MLRSYSLNVKQWGPQRQATQILEAMRQHLILVDSIETLQDLLMTLISHFEGVSLLLSKNSKNSCQSSKAVQH